MTGPATGAATTITSPPAARAKPKHKIVAKCGKGKVSIVVPAARSKKKQKAKKPGLHFCVSVAHATAKSQAQAANRLTFASVTKVRLGPRGHRNRHRLPAWMHGKGLKRALQRASNQRTLAGLTQQQHTQTTVTPTNGWTGTNTNDRAVLDPDTGTPGDWGAQEETDIDLHRGPDGVKTKSMERLALAACPTVVGKVSGRYENLMSYLLTGPNPRKKGQTYASSTTLELVVKVVGHTKPDGTLRDFDLDMAFQSTSQVRLRASGRLVEANAPTFWSLRAVATGLLPGESPGTIGDKINLVADSGFAPNKDLIAYAIVSMEIAAHHVGDGLKTEEGRWDAGVCMSVDLSSSELSLAPYIDINGKPRQGDYLTTMAAGQTARLTATVTAKRHVKPAPGTYTVEPIRSDGSDPGHAAPTHGAFKTTPIGLGYTAPTQDWIARSGNTVDLVVTVMSFQGRDIAEVEISPKPRQYKLVYTHASNGSFTFGYDASAQDSGHGTFKDTHDIALSASAPLTLNANATVGTGSGALTWQRSTWATDDLNTAPNGQDLTLCTLDTKQQVTSTTPGTMTVKSLILGPTRADGTPTIASLDVVLAGANDTWSTTQQALSGPCPAVNNPDYIYNRYLTDLWAAADGWTGQGVQRIYVSPGDNSVKGPGGVELLLASPWNGAPLTSSLPSPDGYGDLAPPPATINGTDSFQLVPVP